MPPPLLGFRYRSVDQLRALRHSSASRAPPTSPAGLPDVVPASTAATPSSYGSRSEQLRPVTPPPPSYDEVMHPGLVPPPSYSSLHPPPAYQMSVTSNVNRSSISRIARNASIVENLVVADEEVAERRRRAPVGCTLL